MRKEYPDWALAAAAILAVSSRCWDRYVSAVVPRVTCLTYRAESGLLVILFLVIAT